MNQYPNRPQIEISPSYKEKLLRDGRIASINLKKQIEEYLEKKSHNSQSNG